MRFLDTNVVLRFLVDPSTPMEQAKHVAATVLFQRVQRGELRVRITESVLTEILNVRCSRRQFGLSHQDAAARVSPILRLRGVRIPRKQVCLRALAIFAVYCRVDLEDALVIAHMEHEGETELYSYDTDFGGVAGITRIEP
jgi:predicted nucleic acid-binding protein